MPRPVRRRSRRRAARRARAPGHERPAATTARAKLPPPAPSAARAAPLPICGRCGQAWGRTLMKIRAGYEIIYDCPQPTPMLLILSVHPSRLPDLLTSQQIRFDPLIPARDYGDRFDNICTRIVAPAERLTIAADLLLRDSAAPYLFAPDATHGPVAELPDAVPVYILVS